MTGEELETWLAKAVPREPCSFNAGRHMTLPPSGQAICQAGATHRLTLESGTGASYSYDVCRAHMDDWILTDMNSTARWSRL